MSNIVLKGSTSGDVTVTVPAEAGDNTVTIPAVTGIVDVFASGTRMAFQQTAAPTGWTKDTAAAINDSAIRLTTGTVGTGGDVGFETAFADQNTGATTLSIAQIPSHTHTKTTSTAGSASTKVAIGSATSTNDNFTTNATGGGGSHLHSIDLDVKFYDFIIAEKD
jgi:hypothetical protein